MGRFMTQRVREGIPRKDTREREIFNCGMIEITRTLHAMSLQG